MSLLLTDTKRRVIWRAADRPILRLRQTSADTVFWQRSVDEVQDRRFRRKARISRPVHDGQHGQRWTGRRRFWHQYHRSVFDQRLTLWRPL